MWIAYSKGKYCVKSYTTYISHICHQENVFLITHIYIAFSVCQDCSKCFENIKPFDPYKTDIPNAFYGSENWSTEKQNDLPKDTQLGNGDLCLSDFRAYNLQQNSRSQRPQTHKYSEERATYRSWNNNSQQKSLPRVCYSYSKCSAWIITANPQNK